MDDKTNLCGLTSSELEKQLSDFGEKSFRGRQIFEWIYKSRLQSFDKMTNLGSGLRDRLAQRFEIRLPHIVDRQKSFDGTEKFLIKLSDNNLIESVLIPDDQSRRKTLCLSSQAGCPLDCKFCATGRIGYGRNLETSEIIGQLLLIRGLYGDDAFDNLVFMGMGEPLLNFDRVMAAIDIMTDKSGVMLSAKRITISTAGITPAIHRLTNSGSKVNLAVSLNSAKDSVRQKLMPVARKYKLAELIKAVKNWGTARKRLATFEYILFKGINDSDDDALALARLVQGIPCKINILAYNEIDNSEFTRPDDAAVDRFAKFLFPRTSAVTVRKSRGVDIAAACGQLAAKKGNQ